MPSPILDDPYERSEVAASPYPNRQHPYQMSSTVYGQTYPVQYSTKRECATNSVYQTLPKDYPTTITNYGPTSVKSLYTNVPNYYPMMQLVRPNDSLYSQDLSQFNSLGVRRSYHYSTYPLTNRNVKERLYYNKEVLKYPTIRMWQSHPIVEDGTIERYG